MPPKDRQQLPLWLYFFNNLFFAANCVFPIRQEVLEFSCTVVKDICRDNEKQTRLQGARGKENFLKMTLGKTNLREKITNIR